MSQYREQLGVISSAFLSLSTAKDPAATLNTAFNAIGKDQNLGSIFIDNGMRTLFTMKRDTMQPHTVRALTKSMVDVCTQHPELTERLQTQGLAVLSNTQNGAAAYYTAAAMVEVHGAKLDHIDKHGLACQAFTFSKAMSALSGPDLHIHSSGQFARASGFLGNDQEYADNSRAMANSQQEVDNNAAFWRAAKGLQQGASYLPPVDQAARNLVEKVQREPVIQPPVRPRAATPV